MMRCSLSFLSLAVMGSELQELRRDSSLAAPSGDTAVPSPSAVSRRRPPRGADGSMREAKSNFQSVKGAQDPAEADTTANVHKTAPAEADTKAEEHQKAQEPQAQAESDTKADVHKKVAPSLGTDKITQGAKLNSTEPYVVEVRSEVDEPHPACRMAKCTRDDGCDTAEMKEGCCTTEMFRMLVAMTSWLDANDEPYVLSSGTLLGARRDGSIIPWTKDLDIAVTKKGLARLSGAMNQGTDAAPYKAWVGTDEGHHGVGSHLGRGCQDKPGLASSSFDWSSNSFFYIDFYDGAPGDTGCDMFSDSTSLQIWGHDFKVPKDVDGCLEKKYGADYMTPDPSHSPHG